MLLFVALKSSNWSSYWANGRFKWRVNRYHQDRINTCRMDFRECNYLILRDYLNLMQIFEKIGCGITGYSNVVGGGFRG